MQYDLQVYQPYFDKKVTLRGIVREDSTYDDRRALELRVDDVKIEGQAMPGIVRITTFDPVQPKRGDLIEVTGKLRDGFGNYQAAVYFGTVRVLGRQVSWAETARHSFAASVLSNVPEPQASLGLGFLLGIKSQLPDTVSEQLRTLGLTHIVVASGYNLTILVRLARRLFAKRSKYQAMLMSVLLMAGFLLVTGFSASMTRAALVTSLSLAAWYYGRRIHPALLLLVTAAITAAINPLYLWADVGWWLSFLAFGGVMLGAPLVQHRLCSSKQPPALAQVAIETVCAQLATLPLILAVFGDFSVLALLANVLIVPLIPLVMLLTFVAGACGWLLPLLAPWVALPAFWLLSYMTEMVGWLSQAPWAVVPLPMTMPGMCLLYAVVSSVGWLLYRKTKLDYLQTSLVE